MVVGAFYWYAMQENDCFGFGAGPQISARRKTHFECYAFIRSACSIRTGQNLTHHNSRQFYQPIGRQNSFGMQTSGMQIIYLLASSGTSSSY